MSRIGKKPIPIPSGVNVTITTTAKTDAEAFALLEALGMPFAREGRPRGFETLAEEPVAA